MQHVSSLNESTYGHSPKHKRTQQYFIHWSREDQLKAFLTWLPEELRHVPGIDWLQLPAKVMGYCVHTLKDNPDAIILTLAAGTAHGALTSGSLGQFLRTLKRLFQSLRGTGMMRHLSDLHKSQLWYDWLASQKKTEATRHQLKVYSSLTTGHFPRYLLRLSEADRLHMRQYALPPLPPDLLRKQFPQKTLRVAQQARRRAQSDVLVPLYPVLRQLVRLRKQLAERVVLAFREIRHKVEAGEVELPFHLYHTDTIPEVNRDARTISEVELGGRKVTMHFIVWDKRHWVIHHQARYSPEIVEEARAGKGPYAPDLNTFFVQFDGEVSDLLWFGDLVEQRLLQHFKPLNSYPEGYQQRWQFARQMGFTSGCQCARPGLLNPGDRWFYEATERGDERLFEPEALYRGVLFGATLATIALSNGSRVNELLQVSWNKERRVTRTETVVILGEDGQPGQGAEGTRLTKQVKIHLQHLLPKGCKSEEERQLFPLSKECMRLIGEVKALLEEAHGAIPVVYPSRRHSKYDHLKPEQYLFQWAATADGQQGCLAPEEVQVLLRFLLHGLELYTAQGKPIRVSVHILRHVMATHARQYRHVPPEVMAHFFLHHRFKELTGHDPSPSEVSDYYFMMTEEQRFAIIRADLDEQEELDRALLRAAPSPRDLEQKNADVQAVYDEWHTLHPTALGNCGCPGLCPRGTDRSLCLGCSYHVEDPEKLGAALAWRASYAQQVTVFEAQGNVIDARQARIKVQLLDDMITVMRMQLQEEAAGRYIPVFKVLPSPYRKAEETHEEES